MTLNYCVNPNQKKFNLKVDRVYPVSFWLRKNPISIRYILASFKIKSNDLVVVHYPNFNAVLAGLIASYKSNECIVLCHSSATHYGTLVSLFYKLILWLYSKKTKYWTTSATLADLLAKDDGIRCSQIQKIGPTQRLITNFDSAEIRTEIFEIATRRYVLVVGRSSSYKGVIADVPSSGTVRVVVCTTNFSEFNLSEEGLITKLDGPLTEIEKQFLIKKAEVVLFQALNVGEGFGLIQLEASRHGVPVFNTYIPTGVIVAGKNRRNALTIAQEHFKYEVIVKILEREYLMKLLRSRSRKYYEKNFSRDILIKSLKQNYESLNKIEKY